MKNFTTFLLFFLAFAYSHAAFAQKEDAPQFLSNKGVEIKVNPIGLLIPAFLAEVEFHPWNYASLSVDIGFGNDGFDGIGYYFNFRHKYFFNTKYGWDKFYFLSQISAGELDDSLGGIGIGFGGGYKLVSKQNVILDFNLSVSRFSNGSVFPLGNILVGYRF